MNLGSEATEAQVAKQVAPVGAGAKVVIPADGAGMTLLAQQAADVRATHQRRDQKEYYGDIHSIVKGKQARKKR